MKKTAKNKGWKRLRSETKIKPTNAKKRHLQLHLCVISCYLIWYKIWCSFWSTARKVWHDRWEKETWRISRILKIHTIIVRNSLNCTGFSTEIYQTPWWIYLILLNFKFLRQIIRRHYCRTTIVEFILDKGTLTMTNISYIRRHTYTDS